MSKVLLSCFLLSIAAAQAENLEIDPRPRIVNGTTAEDGEFPWTGQLISDGHSCTCTLIQVNRVLTAGHCVRSKTRGYVYFGSVSKQSGVRRRYFPNDIALHPEYDPDQIGYDIGIIKLQRAYELSDVIKTVALPSANSDYQGETGILQGFGRLHSDEPTKKLQWTHFTVLDDEHCKTVASKSIYVLCGYYPTAATCAGDSGSGFIMNDNGTETVIGVHSHRIQHPSHPECTEGDISILVRVTDHLDFIQNA